MDIEVHGRIEQVAALAESGQGHRISTVAAGAECFGERLSIEANGRLVQEDRAWLSTKAVTSPYSMMGEELCGTVDI